MVVTVASSSMDTFSLDRWACWFLMSRISLTALHCLVQRCSCCTSWNAGADNPSGSRKCSIPMFVNSIVYLSGTNLVEPNLSSTSGRLCQWHIVSMQSHLLFSRLLAIELCNQMMVFVWCEMKIWIQKNFAQQRGIPPWYILMVYLALEPWLSRHILQQPRTTNHYAKFFLYLANQNRPECHWNTTKYNVMKH